MQRNVWACTVCTEPISDPSVKWETEADSYLLAYSHWHIELCLLSFLPPSLRLHVPPSSLAFNLFASAHLSCFCPLVAVLGSACLIFLLVAFSSDPLFSPSSHSSYPKNKSCIPPLKEPYRLLSFIFNFWWKVQIMSLQRMENELYTFELERKIL